MKKNIKIYNFLSFLVIVILLTVVNIKTTGQTQETLVGWNFVNQNNISNFGIALNQNRTIRVILFRDPNVCYIYTATD